MRRVSAFALLAILSLLGAASADAAGNGSWNLQENTDPMTDQRSLEAKLTGQFDGQNVIVTASCSEDSLIFDYISEADIDWEPSNFVWARVRLDQRPARQIRTTSRHTNELFVLFSNLPQNVVDQANGIVNSGADMNSIMHMLTGQEAHLPGFSKLEALSGIGYAGYAGNLDEMAATTELKVELPFANGTKAIVPITLTDSVLRKLIRSCPMYQNSSSR